MSETVWERIELCRERWNVLQHPFYERWSAGELGREELARYAEQYRHATVAIARLARDVAETAPESLRPELRRHADEEAAHVGLWDDFTSAVGGDPAASATPETGECVAAWTTEDGPLAALTRLYAIESGQPTLSRTKRAGLAAHYGIGDGPANSYFRVHEKLDVEHAAQCRRLVSRQLENADQDALVAAALAAFRANWRLLDGVHGREAELAAAS